jgi:crotonobetainyl-CoA:carnitine CoA-transferase CaiB-like acyl-CoA transferase
MSTFDGIRVVDFSRYLSGPTATMLLADLGADVVKVEGLPNGDPSRESGPFHDGESVYFMCSNRNKRSIAVDMRDPAGMSVVSNLVARADVVVQNFKPGTMEKMGLGYDEIRPSNPRLVYCSISGFGAEGPGRDLPGFDQSAQAMSGLMSVTGTQETGPLRVGIAVADSTAGVFAALGIVSALYERERSGVGQLVETSLIESLLSLMNYQAQKYLSLGDVPGQDGNDHPLIFPQGTFHTADAPITLASGSEAMWRRLCDVLGLKELVDDARFFDNAARMENRLELRRLLEERLRRRSAAEWLEAINGAGIPATPIYSVDQTLESDIIKTMEMIATVDHPTIGSLRVLGRPFTLGKERTGWLLRPPPLLGEHSLEIADEIGLPPGVVKHLVDTGVLVDGRPAVPAHTTTDPS